MPSPFPFTLFQLTDNVLTRFQLFEILNQLTFTLAFLDKEGKILYSNPCSLENSYKLFQKCAEVNQPIWDFLEPQYHEKFRYLMNKAFSGEMVHVPIKLRNINGQQCWFDYTFFPVRGENGLVDIIGVSSNDITAQKVAEERLLENEARYKAVIQDQTELICRYYPNGILTFVNKSYCDFFGISETDLIGKCWFSFIPEFVKDKMLPQLQELSLKKPINQYRQMVVDYQGNSLWLSCTDRAIFDTQGNVLEIQSVAKDITDQVILEVELQKTMQRFEVVLKAIPDPMFVFDNQGTILDCFASNPNRMIASANEIINKNISNFFPPHISQKTIDLINTCLTKKTEQVLEYELVINGQRQYYESDLVFLEDDKVLAISRNITSRKVAEEQLIQSEALYRNLTETSPDAIVIITLDKRVLYVSPKAVKQFGCKSASDLLGTKVKKWVHDEDKHVAENVLQALIDEKESIFNQCKLIRKDKSSFIGEINGTCIRSQNGKTWGYMLVIRDITLRMQYEYQVKLLYTAIEQIPVSVIITDTNGKIEYVNKVFTQYTGYKAEEVKGKTPSILKSGMLSAHIYEELWNSILSGNEWKGELVNKRKDGTHYWESAVIAPVKDNDRKITHFIAVKEDITKRKAFENELIEAKHKAEESDRLKTAFLSNISHEIRTPMNGILGFSSLLNEKNIDEERITEYTGIIKNGCNKLLSIITDMVDISKIEAGLIHINKTSVEINSLLSEVTKQFERIAAINGIELRLYNDTNIDRLEVVTDITKLTQVLTNLIGNAIKFSNNNYVDISYCIKDQAIEFIIKDHGIGISSEFHNVIFERFWQHKGNSIKTNEGMGLGLSISKSYIEQMGGKIWLESETGKGSTFFFTIPCTFSENSEKKLSPKANPINNLSVFKGKYILVAEDEEINYTFVRVILERVGAIVAWAKNGKEAVELVMDKKPDLVLMDIKMPVLNGLEATKIIRKQDSLLPVIALSAFTDEQDKERTMNAGCNEYICKPIVINDFYERVGMFLD